MYNYLVPYLHYVLSLLFLLLFDFYSAILHHHAFPLLCLLHEKLYEVSPQAEILQGVMERDTIITTMIIIMII